MNKGLMKNLSEIIEDEQDIKQLNTLEKLRSLCTVKNCNRRSFSKFEKAQYNKKIDILLARLNLLKGN